MRKIRPVFSLILILMPTISFGQLFPLIEDFNGEIETVVEKRYGKELYLFNKRIRIYLPGCYSGWKYVYHLDTNGRLERRVNSFKGELRADYIYKYDSMEKTIREREIVNDIVANQKGDYIEDEYILDSEGKIERVNIWSLQSSDNSKRIIVVQKNIKYDSINNITSYYRQGYDGAGKAINGELYEIHYDSLSRVIAVEKKAVDEKTILVESKNQTLIFEDAPISEPELLIKWIYKYNSKGQLITYTIEYFGELYKSDSNRGQDYKLFFKYDNKNNWVRMYKQLGDSKKRLEAKRKIEYK